MSALENNIKEAIIELRISGDSLEEIFDKVRQRDGTSDQSQSGKELLSKELNLTFQNIREYNPPADILSHIPSETAHHYGILPLDLIGKTLRVAMVDPTDMDVITDLHLITGLRILPIVSERHIIDEMIFKYYKTGGLSNRSTGSFSASGDKPKSIQGLSMQDKSTPVIRLVNEIISEAINKGASDIHLEPFEREMKVRMRQDGVLHIHKTIHSRTMAEVISRIKIMANMDIAEKRRPQDGRIRMEGADKFVDMRVSTLPTDWGEKIVMRILDKSAVALDLPSLGLDKKGLAEFSHHINLPYGMILVTGPTGSGKSTSLYSALNTIKSPGLNISTVEDPIEQKIDGIVQTAVRSDIGVTFAKALRTLLRQDPNVIMVGEIRDEETAQMAVRAALTGHLLLSTLHTNDAPSTITRLLDMGMEPFLVASSLSLVMAQRLVRKVCDQCSVDEKMDDKTLALLGIEEKGTFKMGKGCMHCNQTGYQGRIGLFEMMSISESIRSLITQKQNASLIRDQALKEGMVTLRQDGIHKIKAGITTPEEVLRETK